MEQQGLFKVILADSEFDQGAAVYFSHCFRNCEFKNAVQSNKTVLARLDKIG